MSLLTGLVAYWKMDEASGNALDAVGSNTLADNGSVGTVSGKINTARSFARASNQWFGIADNVDLSTGGDFSLSFWVNFATAGGFTTTVGVKGADLDTHEWAIFNSFGSLTFRVQNNTASVSLASPTTGALHHVAAWHQAGVGIGLRVDGGTATTASYSGGVTDGTGGFRIGSDVGAFASRYMDGSIDELGFWKRSLSSQDITDLYNGGSGLAFSSFGGGGPAFVAPRPLVSWQAVGRASSY